MLMGLFNWCPPAPGWWCLTDGHKDTQRQKMRQRYIKILSIILWMWDLRVTFIFFIIPGEMFSKILQCKYEILNRGKKLLLILTFTHNVSVKQYNTGSLLYINFLLEKYKHTQTAWGLIYSLPRSVIIKDFQEASTFSGKSSKAGQGIKVRQARPSPQVENLRWHQKAPPSR